MVTIQKIDEKKMGNRGSKSVLNSKTNTVKEQRVDGSWCINSKLEGLHLRCTLMGFERNYRIKYPSKQLIIRSNFSNLLNSSYVLNPWFISGFTDAEGTFTVMIDRNIKRTLGWRVQAKFQISLHQRDLSLLLQIQEYFGGIGSIGKSGSMVFYSVSSLKDLTNIIIPHFDKYYLLTQKAADFMLFKHITKLMNHAAHLSIEGIQQIINIKASMNVGLSNTVQSEFKHITPIDRPIINTEEIPDPHWVTGFVNGEGTFDVKTYSSKNKVGEGVQLRFRIPQHDRDTKLIELLVKYFGSGYKEKHTKAPAVTLVIVKFEDIGEKIIPFFEQYPLIGVKKYDFIDWCKVFKIMSDGSHLTIDGLNLIRTIKSGMNKGRK
jgi:hypothetical protein